MTLEPTVYLLRFSGTISTKSPQTRKQFQQRLERNIRDALDRREVDYDLRREWDRLFVETDDERAGEILQTVFGLQSIRPSVTESWESIDDIVTLGHALFAEQVEGRSFGVNTRRVGQRGQYPFDSNDVNVALGRALDEEGGRVDLDDPEIWVRLEIHGDEVYFFVEDLAGPAGLPLGVEGRALGLISGGFDSAVAAWQMLKRGVGLDFVFFNLGGPPHVRGVRRVMSEVSDRWIHGDDPTLNIVDFRPLLAELKSRVSSSYWQVVLKRLMMRSAQRIARQEGHPALVTGEAIGQVSSQTLPNLAAIEAGVDIPILRPLVGYNKEDIIGQAREIELHRVTKGIPEFCALQGGKPVTSTTAGKLDGQEERMNLELVDVLTDDRIAESVRRLADSTEEEPDVQVDAIPPEATAVDLRPEVAYERWHYPDALHVPFETALDQHALLPPQPTYLLYCDVGLKSALIAEKMQRAGFDAHSFRGGVPKLKKALEKSAQ